MKTPLLEESRKWDVHARCKKGVDPELFFVIDDDRASALRDAQEAKAKEVCKKCPVSGNCLDYAIEYDEKYGVWGGATTAERRAAKRGGSRASCPRCQRRLTTRDDHSQTCLSCGLSSLL